MASPESKSLLESVGHRFLARQGSGDRNDPDPHEVNLRNSMSHDSQSSSSRVRPIIIKAFGGKTANYFEQTVRTQKESKAERRLQV